MGINQKNALGLTTKYTCEIDSFDYKSEVVNSMKQNITRQTKFRLVYRVTIEKNNILRKLQLWGCEGSKPLVNVVSDFNEIYDKQLEHANSLLHRFANEGSGWNLLSVDELSLEYYGLESLSGKCLVWLLYQPY